MNRGPYIFLGAFALLAFSWTAVILANQLGYGSLTPYYDDMAGKVFPGPQPGIVARGANVYTDLGCAVCHTQQVRRADLGGDLARGWGDRASVARDYLQEETVQLGYNRVGPDLRNVGGRYENEEAFYQLLYAPEQAAPGAHKPAYRFLFEETKIVGERSKDALVVTTPVGYQVVPTERARSLVAYLAHLHDTYAYPETNYVYPEEEEAATDEATAEEEGQ
jgi:cytochrome c oxidase cbb3-type subunit II